MKLIRDFVNDLKGKGGKREARYSRLIVVVGLIIAVLLLWNWWG